MKMMNCALCDSSRITIDCDLDGSNIDIYCHDCGKILNSKEVLKPLQDLIKVWNKPKLN